jgi:putative YphP/YqiW family bacilliredoxin
MINSQLKPPLYDPEAVQPMRDELVFVGFEELTTPQKVEEAISSSDDKIKLVVINSVCGCAAGSARPGVTQALQHSKIPDKLFTIFAGQDRDAVDYFRQNYISNIPPTSPSIYLMKNSEVISFLPRHHIEGRTGDEISAHLTGIFDSVCQKEGPSISKEDYAKLVHARACGSRIPMNQ